MAAKPSNQIDAKTLSRHVQSLKAAWEAQKANAFRGAEILAVMSGKETSGEGRRVASWLLGSGGALKDVLVVVRRNELLVVASGKKLEVFKAAKEVLAAEKDPVAASFTLVKRNKGDEKSALRPVVEKITGSLGFIGVSEGPMASAWNELLEEKSIKPLEVTEAVASVLAVKEEGELKCARTAASITVAVLKNFLISKIEGIIDEEKKITHAELARQTEQLFATPEKISKKLQASVVSATSTPYVASGGRYNLAPSATSDTTQLHFDTIVTSVGARYKRYCSEVARTLFIDPADEVQSTYETLVAAFEAAEKAVKPGATLASVYAQARNELENKKPGLGNNFLADCGFSTGQERIEPGYLLSADNKRTLEVGMVIVLRLGLKDISAGGKTHAMLLADTLVLGKAATENLTDKCTKKFTEVSYELGDASEDPEPAPKKKGKSTDVIGDDELDGPSVFKGVDLSKNSIEKGGRTLRKTVVRESIMNNNAAVEAKREEHQRELARAQRERMLERLVQGPNGTEGEEAAPKLKDFHSYRSPADFPSDAHRDFIHVDHQRETVLLPIYGHLVPFHIHTIKSVTKTDDYLRLVFKTPQGAAATDLFKDPKATFVREATFRITNQNNLNAALRRINELKKRVTQRETEALAKASIKEQAALILNKTGKNLKISGLSVRPNVGGRKTVGTLEVHTNGFRFSTLKAGNIDITFDNIKHAIFQPADNSLIVVLHFHLRNEIMVGKKKTMDVQFYKEVMEASLALGQAKSSRWGDAEEVEDEQRERERINKINADFQAFVKRVEEDHRVEFDIPYKDLGFHGVPFRNNVFIQPTVHCLLNVIEFPFFVMSLEDVQIAYFERVQFGLKNFDLVFVFNDWTKKEVHINSIPIDSLETIKEWLDGIDVKYYQGNANVNWRRLLDGFSRNAQAFWEEGGWACLEEESSDEEVKAAPKPKKVKKDKEAGDFIASDEEEVQPVAVALAAGGGDDDESFEMSGDAAASASESSGADLESSFSGENAGSDESASEGGASEDEDDSEGADWDELDRRAMQEDKKGTVKRKDRGEGYSSDEERPVKRAKK